MLFQYWKELLSMRRQDCVIHALCVVSKMGNPKEDIIGAIDGGLSFIADQLMDRTEKFKDAKPIRNYLKTLPSSSPGE